MVEESKIVQNSDGWYNILTGLGLSNFDKRVSTRFSLSTYLDDQTLIDIYRGDGLGRRVIDVPVADMTRNWFYIENDTDNKIVKYLAKYNTKKYIKSSLKWGQLFGGCVLLIGLDDGQDLDKPVNVNSINGLRFFEEYDKRHVSWEINDLYKDKRSAKYGKPEKYTLTNQSTGEQFKVHETRCLVFGGSSTPTKEKMENNGWDDSRLQHIFTRLRGVCDSLAGIEGINTEFIIGIMKVINLQQLLASKDGENQIRNRLRSMDLVKHSMSTIVLDKNEEYERASSFGVAGLRDLVDVLIDVFCGISGIPRIKLIGDQSKGLGGEAAGNIRMYYDEIAAQQEDDLEPQLNTLVKYCIASKELDIDSDIDYRIVFNKLWQPTDKEEAETRLLNAKTDTLYIENGAPKELFITSRFGGQSYGKEIVVPEEYVSKLKSIPIDEIIENAEERIKSKSPDIGESNNTGSTSKDNPGRNNGE